MMKYRNKEHNEKRNSAVLFGMALAAAAAGHILVSLDSAAAAVISLVSVLAALGLSCIRNIISQ